VNTEHITCSSSHWFHKSRVLSLTAWIACSSCCY